MRNHLSAYNYNHDGENGNRSFALFIIIFNKDIIIFLFSGIRRGKRRIPS